MVWTRTGSAYLCATELILLVLLLAGPAFAQDTWVNPGNGLWRVGSNWSAGAPPENRTTLTLITNANTKTVTVDAATPPTNLTVLKLTVSAPVGSTNTLAVLDLDATNPFQLLNTFTIDAGGALYVTNSTVVINGSSGGSFNILGGMAILDSGSLDVSTVTTRVGRVTSGSLLIKTGTVQAGEIIVGEFTGSRGSLHMEGGNAALSSLLSLGDNAGSTGIVSVTGGFLSVTNDITKIGNLGVGQMVVSNAAVALGNVSVARHDGAAGIFDLQTNGIVSLSEDLSIGRFSGATGSVLVTGARLSIPTNTIWVGREGAGQMTVNSGTVDALALLVAGNATNTDSGTASVTGGAITISSNLTVGHPLFSAGQMLISGGRVNVTNEGNTAILNIPHGSLNLNGGTIVTDGLILTNSTGQLGFGGGRLETKGTAVANGAPFIVGDGTSAATLHLVGGTHYFADGLVISKNATLTGCGLIVGNVINNGIIATNCGSTPLPPSITAQPVGVAVEAGATATFSVIATGDAPLSYQWRFNDSDLEGETNSTLSISNVQPVNEGPYTVRVSSDGMSVTSDPAVLRVLVAPLISGVDVAGNAIGFSFSTSDGFTYTVEYKNTLTDLNWTPLQVRAGTGGALTASDTTTSAPTRFYRVRAE